MGAPLAAIVVLTLTVLIGVAVMISDLVNSVSGGLKRLGNPQGTDEIDWVTAMRRGPHAISAMQDGQLFQWSSGQYTRQHIAVLFDAQHRFVKITHRYQC